MSEKKWIIYLLECGDETLYCGITNNIYNRLKQHRGEIHGGAKYTRSRGPIKLVYLEKTKTRGDAQKREIMIKRMSREEKLKIISSQTRFNSGDHLNH